MPSHPNNWQQLWSETLPGLEESLPATRRIESRKARASQLDAQALDDDLVGLLREPISRSVSMLTDEGSVPFEPEFLLLLRALIFKYSIWDTGASYGSRLQGLSYSLGSLRVKNSTSRRPLALFFAFSVLLPYFHSRLRNHAMSKSWPDLPASNLRRKLWSTMSACEATHNLLSTLSFIVFLWKGSFRSVSERLARLSLTSVRPSSSREVSFDFMNRQMAWHAFTEFLLFAVPLLHWSRSIKKLKKALLARARSHRILQPGPSSTQQNSGLPDAECAICHERARNTISQGSDRSKGVHLIQTPYVTPCGHRFCYFCVSEKILQAAEEDSYWECLRCSRPVYNVLRCQEGESDDQSEDLSDM